MRDLSLDVDAFDTTGAPAPVVTHISLIQSWFEELEEKVPVKR
jgi:hypothetical protein